MNPSELQSIIDAHGKWVRSEEGGVRANLYGANLRYANLYGANLRCANLYGANLRCANLYGSNLRYANLYGANLRCANLYGANLRCANLYGSNLDGANLRCANLDGANLVRANLDGANLVRANLDGANLDGRRVFGAYGTRGGIGERGRALLVICAGVRSEWVWTIGCFRGNEAELIAEINRRHRASEPNRRTCIRAVEYLVATAEDERNTPEGGYRTILEEYKNTAFEAVQNARAEAEAASKAEVIAAQ